MEKHTLLIHLIVSIYFFILINYKANELWVMLLEKAFAKYLGSYQDLDGKNPAIALEALSGGHVDYMY